MHLEPGWTYRFGAKLKKPGTEVRLRAAKGFGGHGPATILKFGDGALEAEQVWTNSENFLKAKIEVVTTVALSDVIEKVWLVPVPPKGWKPGTPRADYVPLDDVFRTALHSEPPQPEFWQLRGEAGFSISDGGGTISHIIGPKFIDSEGNIPSELMSDYLHPTDEGYAIWRAALEPFFRSVCGK